jgi:chemotaxis protein methyltransferase CheR
MTERLTDAQFAAIRDMLAATAGLHFDNTRRQSLTYFVRNRLEESGCPDVDAYLALVTGPDNTYELQRLIDEATVQETYFFRNTPQIRALRRHVLPELIKHSAERPLTIWSAGCATGEEPYTIAMLVRELLPNATPEQVTILATDVSTAALEAARAAHYGPRAVAMTEPGDVNRWFIPEKDGYRVRDDVRDLVTFRHHNLVTEPVPYAPGQLDLLLCRNVTIYFSRATTRALMERFHAALSDGGYLFLGHSETLWQLSDAFTLVPLGDAFVYRKNTSGQRRSTLPDRRLASEVPPVLVGERRGLVGDRRRNAKVVPTQPTVADHLRAARQALASGRYLDVIEQAKAGAAIDPLDAEAHLLAGQGLANLGRHAEAVPELRKVLYLDPGCARAHLLLAGSLDRLGERAAAARSYRMAAAVVNGADPRKVADLLEGRKVSELVNLCTRLAEQAEQAERGMRGMEVG